MVIGDDSGSRLYWALVDPGLADSADMSFHDYEGTGSLLHLVQLRAGAAREENLAIDPARSCTRCRRRASPRRSCRRPRARSCRAWCAAANGRWAACRRSAWAGPICTAYRSVDDELANFEAVTLQGHPRRARPLPVRPADDAGAGAAGEAGVERLTNRLRTVLASRERQRPEEKRLKRTIAARSENALPTSEASVATASEPAMK